jgi:hypothetical protein
LTKEVSTRFVPEGHDRIIDKWIRPDEFGPGWTLACHIWVPGTEVATIGAPRGRQRAVDSIIWLPRPSDGEAMGLHVALGKPNRGVSKFTDSIPVAGFSVDSRDGSMEACLVFVSQMKMTSEQKAQVQADKVKVLTEARSRGVNTVLPSLRAYTYRRGERDQAVFWDLCLTPGPPAALETQQE